MGIDYYVYSEVKDKKGNWQLLNPTRKYKRGKKPMVSDTCYGRSWLYDVIQEIEDNPASYRVKRNEMSEALKTQIYCNDDYEEYDKLEFGDPLAIDFRDFVEMLDNLEKKSGYVPVDEIDDYEKNHESIYGALTVREYMAIKDADVKAKFKWYEWYPEAEMKRAMEEIISHHQWFLYDYKNLNNIYVDSPESRIVIETC